MTSVAGVPVEDFGDIGRAVFMRAGERVAIGYVRGGAGGSAEATVAAEVERDRFGNRYPIGRLGIGSTAPTVIRVGALAAPRVAGREFGEILSMTVDGIGRIVTGRVAVSQLQGPIGTAKVAGEQFSLGWGAFVFLVAVLSINLGFINLLPVPMLDGGHLFFYAIEAVRRRPLEPRAQEWAFRGGLVALLALMLVVTANDLGAFGLWKSVADRWAGLIG